MASISFFAAILNYAPKPEVDFWISKKYSLAFIMIIQRPHIKEWNLYVIWFDLQTLLKFTKDIFSKNSKKKIAISRSNLKISKKPKKNAFRLIYLWVLHVKNQHPRPKTVAYRPQTDRETHTDRQTNRKGKH